MEFCLPLMYRFYPFEFEILNKLNDAGIVEPIVKVGADTGVFGTSRGVIRIKFHYDSSMRCDGDTILMLSLRGLRIKDEYVCCSRASQGHVTILSNILHTQSFNMGSLSAEHFAALHRGMSFGKGGFEHAAVFDGYVHIAMKYFMQEQYDYSGEVELFLLDILEEGGPGGILANFKLWQTAPSQHNSRTARLVIIQPCHEIKMFATMQRTFLVIVDSLDGEELRQLFVKCFDECPKARSWPVSAIVHLLSSTIMRPASGLDLKVVSKLATMFANEHLAVAPNIRDQRLSSLEPTTRTAVTTTAPAAPQAAAPAMPQAAASAGAEPSMLECMSCIEQNSRGIDEIKALLERLLHHTPCNASCLNPRTQPEAVGSRAGGWARGWDDDGSVDAIGLLPYTQHRPLPLSQANTTVDRLRSIGQDVESDLTWKDGWF